MTTAPVSRSSSYEVVLDGTLGPVYLAGIEALGIGKARTTSTFLVPVHASSGIGEILGRLTARGLVILDVRRVLAERAIASTARDPDAVG